MIVTASEIAPAVAKLIMWGLFEFFDIDDIYSSAKKPKTRVFQHLLEDLCADNHPPQFVGKNATYWLSLLHQLNCEWTDSNILCTFHL